MTISYQVSSPPWPPWPPLLPPPTAPPSSKPFIPTPAIVAVIAVLGAAFLLVSYYICSRYFRSWRGLRAWLWPPRPAVSTQEQPMADAEEAWINPPKGLDEALIRRIPVFGFRKDEGLTESTECVVCLTEFQDDEQLRLLPKCSHAFHVPCVDKWLQTHSNCPLCRANVFKESPIARPGNPMSSAALAPDRRDNRSASGLDRPPFGLEGLGSFRAPLGLEGLGSFRLPLGLEDIDQGTFVAGEAMAGGAGDRVQGDGLMDEGKKDFALILQENQSLGSEFCGISDNETRNGCIRHGSMHIAVEVNEIAPAFRRSNSVGSNHGLRGFDVIENSHTRPPPQQNLPHNTAMLTQFRRSLSASFSPRGASDTPSSSSYAEALTNPSQVLDSIQFSSFAFPSPPSSSLAETQSAKTFSARTFSGRRAFSLWTNRAYPSTSNSLVATTV